MPSGAPYVVYTYEQLGVQIPVKYTVTVNADRARVDEGISFTGFSPDDPEATSVPITEAVWQSVGQRLQALESKTWPPAHGQQGGAQVSVKSVSGDAISAGESAGSVEVEKFAAIEHVIEPVKQALGDLIPGVHPQ